MSLTPRFLPGKIAMFLVAAGADNTWATGLFVIKQLINGFDAKTHRLAWIDGESGQFTAIRLGTAAAASPAVNQVFKEAAGELGFSTNNRPAANVLSAPAAT